MLTFYNMMKIPLTHGQFALIDAKDYAEFGYLNWFAQKGNNGNFYAMRKGAKKKHARRGTNPTLYLAREILGLTDPLIKGDHINHDTLDCRRGNLRPATNTQNIRNRKGANRNSASGIRGVFWHKGAKKWAAAIKIGYKVTHLGLFSEKDAAAAAYAAANREHFGEFGGGL